MEFLFGEFREDFHRITEDLFDGDAHGGLEKLTAMKKRMFEY